MNSKRFLCDTRAALPVLALATLGSLLAAFLVGAGIEALSQRNSRIWLDAWPGICLVMLAAQMLPWVYPRLCSMPENPVRSDLAPGEYRLVASPYDTETGQRLPAALGGEVIELSQV